MQEGVRQQYLMAMGIDVWVRRAIPVDIANESATQSQASVKPEPESKIALTATVDREILQQNPTELTRWLSTQCLMPVRVGDVSVTTIGRPDAQLLVLSECTVLDKVTHQPFSGRAAFLLQAMLRAIGESFESVLQAELDTFHSDAEMLVSLLQNKTIKAVLLLVDLSPDESADSLSRFREQIYLDDNMKTRIFVSYHPDYLLAHPETKALAWEDLKHVRDYLADK